MVESKRDAVFDVVKFFAIVMVVYWHLISMAPSFGDVIRHKSAAINFVLGCNMPVFFVVSGFFARRMLFSCDWLTLGRRMLTYFWPVLFFSVPKLLFEFPADRESSIVSGWIIVLLFYFWFFFCLALCEISTFVAHVLGRVGHIPLPIILLVGFVVAWALPWGMWYYIEMVVFYWFGVYVLPQLYRRSSFLAIALCCFIVYCALSLMMGNIYENGLCFYNSRMSLCRFEGRGFVLMLMRYMLELSGTLGLIGVSKFLVDRVNGFAIVGKLGRTTLGVYFLHTYIIIALFRVFGDSQLARFVFLWSILIFGACHCFVLLSRWLPLLRVIMWGPCLRGGSK